MLAEIILACDGKKPQRIEFDGIFDYHGKKNLQKLKSLKAVADTQSMSLAYLGDIFPGLQILRLDGSFVPSLRDLSAHLNVLRVLSLSGCRLTSLEGISVVCPKIQELNVGFNRIDEVTDLIGLNSLKTLNLESNRIGYVEDVEVLNCCINLKNLVLRGNWAQDHPDYRGAIKRLLPKLICLDDIKFGEEALQLPENPPPDNGQAPLAITYEPFPQMALPPPAHSAQLPRQAQILPPLASSGEGEESRPSSDPSVRQGLVPSTKLVKPVLKPKTWYNVGSIKL